jgi:hypothetical protein
MLGVLKQLAVKTVGPAAPAPNLGSPGPITDGPGPLTMAVCDFFAACAHASDRVEATLLMERRAVTVTVKFQLPE